MIGFIGFLPPHIDHSRLFFFSLRYTDETLLPPFSLHTTCHSFFYISIIYMYIRKLQLVSPLVESVAPSDVFATLDFSLIYWSVLPRQFGEWFVMTIILAFSTCLDVAAIEIDLGRPVDINYELETIGISNLIAGCFAGLPGSFIISQSTYTARTTRHMKPYVYSPLSSFMILCLLACLRAFLSRLPPSNFAIPLNTNCYFICALLC